MNWRNVTSSHGKQLDYEPLHSVYSREECDMENQKNIINRIKATRD